MDVGSIQVLIVDNNLGYQKSLQKHLESTFMLIKVLSDWKSGLKFIKETIPNILITDINSEDMDVLGLLKRIKRANPNIQVIVTSAHFEVESLLEAIHVGIADFIPKPIDFPLLDEALEKSIVNLEQVIPKEQKKKEKKENIFDELRYMADQNDEFEFTNYYKGVPISRKGSILSVGDSSVQIKLDNVQFQALLFEKFIVFENKESQQVFIGKLYATNQKERTAKLKDLKYMQYSPKRRVDVRVAPDDNFKLVVVKNNVPFRVLVHDVSVKSISFEYSVGKEKFSIDDEVVLNIAIYRKIENTHDYKSVLKVDTSVYRVVPKGENINVIVIFDLNGDTKESITKYIYERQLEIISEFREHVKKIAFNQKK